jgi:hypothetical protein
MMNNSLKFIPIVIGLGLFSWGGKLIHHNYSVQRDVTYILKSGSEDIPAEISSSHSKQAVKELTVHLGLVALGVSFVLVPLVTVRKTHNQSLKSGTPKSGAP